MTWNPKCLISWLDQTPKLSLEQDIVKVGDLAHNNIKTRVRSKKKKKLKSSSSCQWKLTSYLLPNVKSVAP